MPSSISQNPQHRKQCRRSLHFIDDDQSMEALQSCHWFREARFICGVLKIEVMRPDRSNDLAGERRLAALPRSQKGHYRRAPRRITKSRFKLRSFDQFGHPCILSVKYSKYKEQQGPRIRAVRLAVRLRQNMAASISLWDDVVKPCIPLVVFGVLSYVVSLVPQLGPYFLWHLRFKVQMSPYPNFQTWSGVAAELPLYAWLPLPLVPWTAWRLARRLSSRPAVSQPEVQRAKVGGLEWDIMPEFFESWHEIEDPSLGALSLRGPYCARCKGSLHQPDPYGLGEDCKMIPNPCPSCGTRHDVPSNVSIRDAKAQVYRELQRQVRSGQLVAPNS